jgi:hypothetical protein
MEAGGRVLGPLELDEGLASGGAGGGIAFGREPEGHRDAEGAGNRVFRPSDEGTALRVGVEAAERLEEGERESDGGARASLGNTIEHGQAHGRQLASAGGPRVLEGGFGHVDLEVVRAGEVGIGADLVGQPHRRPHFGVGFEGIHVGMRRAPARARFHAAIDLFVHRLPEAGHRGAAGNVAGRENVRAGLVEGAQVLRKGAQGLEADADGRPDLRVVRERLQHHVTRLRREIHVFAEALAEGREALAVGGAELGDGVGQGGGLLLGRRVHDGGGVEGEAGGGDVSRGAGEDVDGGPGDGEALFSIAALVDEGGGEGLRIVGAQSEAGEARGEVGGRDVERGGGDGEGRRRGGGERPDIGAEIGIGGGCREPTGGLLADRRVLGAGGEARGEGVVQALREGAKQPSDRRGDFVVREAAFAGSGGEALVERAGGLGSGVGGERVEEAGHDREAGGPREGAEGQVAGGAVVGEDVSVLGPGCGAREGREVVPDLGERGTGLIDGDPGFEEAGRVLDLVGGRLVEGEGEAGFELAVGDGGDHAGRDGDGGFEGERCGGQVGPAAERLVCGVRALLPIAVGADQGGEEGDAGRGGGTRGGQDGVDRPLRDLACAHPREQVGDGGVEAGAGVLQRG